MKSKTIIAITGLILASSLVASLTPDKPIRSLPAIDTVKVVCIYAVGMLTNV